MLKFRLSMMCISTLGFLKDWRKLSDSSDQMTECAVWVGILLLPVANLK